jgi:acyl-CoA thioester hydrolase
MNDKLEAPILSPVLAIEDGWIDYNGHLNQAYYGVLFDRALDEILVMARLGPGYAKERQLSYMTVEIHYCYTREIFKSDPVQVSALVLGVDEKRLHMFCELKHAREHWLSCTSEWMFLHVDMRTRKTVPWPADVREKLDDMLAASQRVGWPERAGRAIAIPRKTSVST